MPTTPRGRSSLLAAVVLILGAMLCVTALVALGRDPGVVVALTLAIAAPSIVSLIGIARTEALHNDLSNGLIREKLGEAVVEQAVAGNLAAIADGSTPPAPPGGSG